MRLYQAVYVKHLEEIHLCKNYFLKYLLGTRGLKIVLELFYQKKSS